MHCGQMISAPRVANGPSAATTSIASAAARRPAWMAIVAGVLVFAALLVGLNVAGVLKLGGRMFGPSSLQAEGAQSSPSALTAEGLGGFPSTLEARGSTGPPTLPAQGSRRLMPDDVRRWLEHLERIERRRIEMTELQMASAMASMMTLQAGGGMDALKGLLEGDSGEGWDPGKTNPVDSASRDFDAMRADWTALTDEFNALAPPVECQSIRNEYDQVVRETGAMILDILRAVDQADEDRTKALAALIGMQGRSESRIGLPATRSDRLVQEICDKYETRKWFSIARDVGGGGSLKGLGLPTIK